MFETARAKWALPLAAFFLMTTAAFAGVTVKANIQKMGGWSSCTTCAGAGGRGPSATFGFQQFVKSPSLSGGSMKFSIGGRTPFSDALWWKQLGGSDGATHFVYDLDFYITSPQVAQALEFDVNQSNRAHKFIFGTECSIGRKEWDVWDTAGRRWIHTGAACPNPAAFKWHHLTWEFSRTGSTAHFISVTMDGVKHYINRSFNVQGSGVTELNVAFQMDGNRFQQAYSTWLDNVTLRYW
jgi:hypothetical protein